MVVQVTVYVPVIGIEPSSSVFLGKHVYATHRVLQKRADIYTSDKSEDNVKLFIH